MINKVKVEAERVTTYNFKKTMNIALVVYEKKENIRMISLNKDRIEVISTVINRFNYDLKKSLSKIALLISKPPTTKATYDRDLSQLTKYFRNIVLLIQAMVNR